MRRWLSFVCCLVLAGCSSSGGGATTSGDDATPGDDAPTSGDDATSDAPVPASVCTVAAKGTAGVAVRGRVLAPSGPLDGEVLVDATGKITCVAASCAATAGYAQATQLACPGGVIAPGFVNAHDHTDYDVTTPVSDGKTRYDHRNGWRKGTGGATPIKQPTPTTDPNLLAAAELRFVMGGATSIVGSGGTQGFLRNLASFKNPGWMEGLTGKTVYFDTFPLGDSGGVELTSGCAYPSIRTASSAFADGAYAPHIAEGVNLAAENELTCLTSATTNLVQAQTAVIHAVGLNARDVDVLARSKAKVVWSPRSNIDLYGNTASVTVLKNAGVTVALGTDWLASGSMNVLRELKCADDLNQRYFAKAFSDQELFAMATHNAAVAAAFDTQIGDLAPGLVGDVVVYDGRVNKDYRAAIDGGAEDVHLVVRGGKPLYGDADLVGALASTCAALDVCGTARLVCVDVPSVTLASIQTAVAASYPLFFCKAQAPTAEPSCVPYRDTYPNGTSATDRDGDGVDDAKDDCPDVFNPARPMDNGVQSDVDGDGFGDACDAKPLDKSAH